MGRTSFCGRLLLAMLLAVFCTVLMSPATGSAYTSHEWWRNLAVTAKGHGIKSANADKAVVRTLAMTKARRNLAENIADIRLTSHERIGEKAAAIIADKAKLLKERFDSAGNLSVTVGVPVYGEDSLANMLFKQMKKSPIDSPDTTKENKQGYTSLVIDCIAWEKAHNALFDPVLIPEIKDERGKVIFGEESVDYATAVKSGYVFYAQELSDSTAGDRPLVVSVVDIADEFGTPVVSAEDAARIVAENGATHFLENGAVIILSRGIELDLENILSRGGAWGVIDSDVYS